MKYVLLLSLFYKHYKKSSTLKLFLDNKLIDEIVLNKNIDPIPNFQEKQSNIIDKVAVDVHKNTNWVIGRLKGRQNVSIYNNNLGKFVALTKKQIQKDAYEKYDLERLQNTDDKEFTESTQIKIPSKLWLYFLELDNTNKHISLNFEIHDNNYSNSFMTNTAMIKIHRVGLIPENLFYDKQKILPRLCKDIRNYFIISKKQEKLNRMSIHKSYRRYYERRDWPFVSQYECTWIGGSEKIEIPIIKKHNIFMLRCDEDYNESQAHPKKGFILIDPYLFWLKRHQQVINITNEDQRSYNTQKNR